MNGAEICPEPDGAELVDVAVFPNEQRAGAFASYYSGGLPQFFDEMDAAVADARARHGVRVFNMSLNMRSETSISKPRRRRRCPTKCAASTRGSTTRHPIHNRLAIILIDNAIELMMRQALYAQTAFGVDFNGITAKHLKAARSQQLPTRIGVLVFAKEFTQAEADFILVAHGHRNAVYHEGSAGEPFLRQLALHYYVFACRYIARFSKAYDSWSSNFKFTEIGQRYYDASQSPGSPIGQIDRAKLSEAMLAQLPASSEASLQTVLADDLEDDRSRIAGGYAS